MSEFKGTPGPWHWDSDLVKGDPLNRKRYRVVACGKTITQCYYSSDDSEVEHDTHLLAAAPDLLEALKYALPYLKACVPNPRNGLNADCSVDVNCIDRAQAAIAKALGEDK